MTVFVGYTNYEGDAETFSCPNCNHKIVVPHNFDLMTVIDENGYRAYIACPTCYIMHELNDLSDKPESPPSY